MEAHLPRRLHHHARPGTVVLLLLAASVGLASCIGPMPWPPPPTKIPFVLTTLPKGASELSFETLGKDYSGALLSIREPSIVIVASTAENRIWDSLFFPGVLKRLREPPQNIDFGSDFALAAFQGYRGCIGPTIEIKQIVHEMDVVHVYAYFTEILPQEACPTQATSPFHLVRVHKKEVWDGQFTFILYDNDRRVAETKYAIP